MEPFFKTVGQYWEVELYSDLESFALIQARDETVNLGDGTKNQREKNQLRYSYSSAIPYLILLSRTALTSIPP